eukprot:94185-Amphidinium_carterae.1
MALQPRLGQGHRSLKPTLDPPEMILEYSIHDGLTSLAWLIRQPILIIKERGVPPMQAEQQLLKAYRLERGLDGWSTPRQLAALDAGFPLHALEVKATKHSHPHR